VDSAHATQLTNIEKKTGRTVESLFAVVRDSGLNKHGAMRDMLKADLGMGHGDANLIVHLYREAAEGTAGAADADPLDEIYSGPKADLRSIHTALMEAIGAFGDFEIAPKKTYVSLRRKKQFATIGPATKTRFEVGLNMKGVEGTERLLAQKPGGMCQYKVNLTDAAEVDSELLAWIELAYRASE